ncbi:response regulator transcription factor [Paenibacillus sp. OAS669]|uniref:response regulator transcription factor n=1 Tax=Paenibacillus sp. OAS669 TaxID=2663821 RepID=UPI00178AB963|nr:response regulator transcription factor [Paenibacillus sp. OAS669]MBE1447056.1 DNA-binding response OmpR family regulator [Paenibacillus sp. OAS669]
MYRILIVEDDDKIASILQSYMERYGYSPQRATDFRDIKQQFMTHKPDLVLLDINLPHYDGFYWCRQIRTVSNVPIIFLSARVGEMDQVMAIENGGDDYITKPFHLDVVIAKVKSVLRRTYGEYAGANPMPRDTMNIAGLILDTSKNTMEWNGVKMDLSRNEFLLMNSLARHADRIVTRETLLEALWDDIDFVDDNTLTVNVTRVRKKLEELGIVKAIETVRGQGYRLNTSWGSTK